MEGERHTTPWASGRVLTKAQRERKREVNRFSRKWAADRAKARIAMLEERLRSVETSLAEIGLSGQQPFLNQNIQYPATVHLSCSTTGKNLAL